MSHSFACKVLAETGSAVQVVDLLSEEEVWVPRSAVIDLDVDEDGDGTMEIEDWIARKKGLV